MANTREIRRRIRSAKNVAQITKAMEMVSASKMRRAQRNVLATRPYADRLRDVMSELASRMLGGARRGTLLEPHSDVKHVALIIVTPDRGLCGSLVSNVLRRSSRFILDQREQGRDVDVYALGKKAAILWRDMIKIWLPSSRSWVIHPRLPTRLVFLSMLFRDFVKAAMMRRMSSIANL